MKELTIEQKAQRYNEALKRARAYYSTTDSVADAEIIELIFPELKENKESEDERIELLNYLYDVHDDDEERARWISWLKSLRPQNKCTCNPYKAVVESIAEMCKHYDKATDLQDFYDNVKVKCKDAKEYDSLFPQSQWKPSEGQLECLGYAIEKAEKDFSPLINNRIYLTLKSLKKQLEKL